MRVAASPFPFAESSPQQAKGGRDYGRGFESAIRTAEKGGVDAEPVAQREPDAKPAKPPGHAKESGSAQKVKAMEGKASKDAKAPSEAEDATGAKDNESVQDGVPTMASSADDLLARLLGGAPTTPTAAVSAPNSDTNADKGDGLDRLAAEAVLEERIVVISLEAGASEPVSDAAAGARSTVKLEVVHMETHFEPRSDAFVLVERQGDAAKVKAAAVPQDVKGGIDRSAATESTAPKLSFDEALARLSDRQAGAEADRGSEGRRGEAAEDKAAQRSARKNAERIDARSSGVATAAKDEDGAGLPQPLASMTGQVAGRVIEALGPTLANQRSADMPQSDTYLKMTAGGAALKTLTIQLQPEHLGRLDVSMRLVEGQLTLEIAATEASTAKVLAEDRDGLRKLLQHAGFSLDDTAITIVSRDAQAHGRIASASESAAAQQDGSASRNSGSAPERDSRQPSQDGGREGGRRPAQGERPKTASRSSATYV